MSGRVPASTCQAFFLHGDKKKITFQLVFLPWIKREREREKTFHSCDIGNFLGLISISISLHDIFSKRKGGGEVGRYSRSRTCDAAT